MSYRLVVVVLVAACSSDSPPPDVPAGCNPLVGDDCLTPFPSSFVEVADSTTATGVHVAIPDAVLPVQHTGVPLSPARYNRHDGISPATPFVVYFKQGVDPSMLPSLDTIDQSITPQSSVQVIEYASGDRVPLFAELDANAMSTDRQALLIRPQVRLKPATRYVIALVGLVDANGKPIEPAPFVALRDHKPLNKSLAAVKATYEDIFSTLETAGVPRASLTLAWDVTTASDADSTSHLLAMRDQGLPMVDSLQWTVTSSVDAPTDPNHFREVVGTFQVPWFLTDATQTANLSMDGNGNPVMNGMGTANFVVDIPQCARTATGPLPVQVFGHGLFGNAKDELATHYVQQVGNYLCAVQIGTDWTGLATTDFPVIAGHVLSDFNQITIVTDRLQQAHLNAQLLTRLFLRHMKDDPNLQINSKAVTDGSQIYYYGISDGGIQGATFMALNEDITRGALNVPGCEWSLLINRSSDFNQLSNILGVELPDPLDQQILLALIQADFDYTDPIHFAPHLLADPLPGAVAKQILVQEAIGDAQVTNVATHVLARTMGLSAIDLEKPIYGLPQVAAPQSSAYTEWDVMAQPVPPPVNQAAPMDNGAHGAIRKLTLLEQQLQTYFATGQITQTCTGPCVCDLAGGTCMMPAGVN